jgi:hypothetical protein
MAAIGTPQPQFSKSRNHFPGVRSPAPVVAYCLDGVVQTHAGGHGHAALAAQQTAGRLTDQPNSHLGKRLMTSGEAKMAEHSEKERAGGSGQNHYEEPEELIQPSVNALKMAVLGLLPFLEVPETFDRAFLLDAHICQLSTASRGESTC